MPSKNSFSKNTKFDAYDVIAEAVKGFEKDIREKKLELKIDAAHAQMCTDRRAAPPFQPLESRGEVYGRRRHLRERSTDEAPRRPEDYFPTAALAGEGLC